MGEVVVWVAVVMFATPRSILAAQIGTGAIVGEVADSAGATVPGAQVVATSQVTRLSWTATTDRDGRYTLARISPGVYEIRVAVEGFRPLIRQGVRVVTGETVRLDLAVNRRRVGGRDGRRRRSLAPR